MTLEQNISQILDASTTLNADRVALLENAAKQMKVIVDAKGEASLLFVCTHNSRRSHFSDVWARVAAEHYGVDGVSCASCGTEATEANPRTVASLRRTGFDIPIPVASENPVYTFSYGDRKIELFSKAFGHSSLPTSAIVAMMCCDDADVKCPVVPGADARVPLHYVDPKVSDGQDFEEVTYDERSHEIAAEMFFLLRAYKELT